ncbi:hypothetical protein [Streptomyces goshikiensis]
MYRDFERRHDADQMRSKEP